MNINQHNYEAFFLDYVEGNLVAEDVATLMLFLEDNPQLRDELEAFESMALNDEAEAGFDAKESLKKTENDLAINAANCTDLFIAFHEGDLSAERKLAVEEFLRQHPAHQAEFDELATVYLEADMATAFAAKLELHHDAYAAPITESNCEFFFIAFYEGDLSLAKRTELETFLAAAPHLTAHFESFANLTLVADQSLVFGGKAELEQEEKRRGIIIPMWRYAAMVAAAAAILFFMFRTGAPDSTDEPNDSFAIHNNDSAIDVQEQPQVANNATIDSTTSMNDEVPLVADDINDPQPKPSQEQPNLLQQSPAPDENLAQEQQLPLEIDSVVVPEQSPILPDQELIAVIDSNNTEEDTNKVNTAFLEDEIAQTTPTEFLTPKEMVKQSLLDRLAGKHKDGTANNDIAVAVGNTETEEQKFSFVRKNKDNYRSVDLKIGGFSLSQKKREKAVTNTTP